MQMFIPSLLSAFQALFKCSHWLLWKVIKIFIGWKKSILPQRPPSDPHPHHDFNGIGSQGGLLPIYRQSPQSRPAGSYYTATSQSADYQTPPQSYLPHHRSDALYPTVTTPVVHLYTPVIRPVECIQQSSPPSITTVLPVIGPHEDHLPLRFESRREIISRRQHSQQSENLVPPDAPVTEPAQVEFTVQSPPVITTASPVIEPHEDYAPSCLELKRERLRAKRPSHQSENVLPLDAPVTEFVEITQQSPPPSTTVPPVIDHEDHASPHLETTGRRKSKRTRKRSQQSENLVPDALVTLPTYTGTQPPEDHAPPRFESRCEIISTKKRSQQSENLVPPDAPVTELAQVEFIQQSPPVITTALPVIDPHEDSASPCLELKHERLRTKGPSHQSENLLPFDAVTEFVEITQQSPPPSTTVLPVIDHEDHASPRLETTGKRKSKRARRRSQQSENLVPDASVTLPTYTDTQPPGSTITSEVQVVAPLVINPASHEDRESLRLTRGRSQQSEDLVPDALVSQSVTSTHLSLTPLATDTYLSLRCKARHERDNMRKCFSKSKKAKATNNQKLAAKLIVDGEAHRKTMVLLNRKASVKIYQEKNQKRKHNIIDLHRQHVPDAESYFKKAVKDAQDRRESSILVIVGKGIHSDDGIPKIKPAILSLGQSLPGISIKVHPFNAGCLIVDFN